MAENVKIVAEFQDNASAGIKKVDDAVKNLSNNETGKGIGGLSEALKNLGSQFSGLTQGGTDALESIKGIAGGAADAATSVGGLSRGAGLAAGGVLGLVAAAGAAYVGLESMARGAREAADGAAELADKLGISLERLETLNLIASENAGSVEGLQRIFDKLSRQMQKLDDDSEMTEYAFASLGLSMEELAGKSEQEIAGIVIKNWEALDRSTKATAAAQQILGGSFRDQVPAIKELSTNLEAYEKRVKDFGAVATPDLVEAGGKQEQATSDLGLAWKGLANEVSRWTGQMMTDMTNWASKAINSVRGVLSELRRMEKEGVNPDPDAVDGKKASDMFQQARRQGGTYEEIKKRYNDMMIAEKEMNKQRRLNAQAQAAYGDIENAALEQVEKDRLKAKSEAAEKPTKGGSKKDEFKEALMDMERQLAVTKETGVYEKILFETQSGRFKDFKQNQKDQLLGIAKQVDLRNAQLKKEEELKKIQEEAAKQIKTKQETEAQSLALQEYEISLAGMTADERKKLLDIKKQELEFQRETKNLSDAELAAAKVREADLNKRRDEIRASAKEAATINTIMDQSKDRIQASVTENLLVAKKLLDTGKITVDDYVKYQNTQLERLGMKVEEVTDEWTVMWKEAAKNTQNIMADFFFDVMQGKFSDLADSFKTMLDRMVAQALAAKLAEALFGANFGKSGDIGGWVGAGMSWLGGIFGGGRATGGDVNPGKIYQVGENGPEMFVPKVAGTILPSNTMGAVGSGTPTYQISINAVDTESFRSALARDPRFIADLVNKTTRAYNMG